MNDDNGNIGIITQERIGENKKLDIGCKLCGCIPKPDEWSGKFREFALIVDSIWFYPILFIAFMAILFLFDI